jgi:outer membrane protein OmpA-like peptidoglycan-associated protein
VINKYLEAKSFENIPKEKRNELFYETKEFEIIQRLIPLNKKRNKTTIDSAVFYHCEYCIKNKTKSKATYSFRQILDFSSIMTDKLQLVLDGKLSRFNKTHISKELPSEIFIGDKAANDGVILLTSSLGLKKPTSVSIGDWHFLKNLEIKPSYSDSNFYKNPAVLLRWKKNVAANDSVKFAFIIGSMQKEKLQFEYNQAEEVKSLIANYETNKHEVSKKNEEEILDFIKKYKYDFIVLEGFTDNRGTLEKNYLLAKMRVENIKMILSNSGNISSDRIISKVHGEFFSNQKAKNKEIDDKEERKVKIVLFKNQQ